MTPFRTESVHFFVPMISAILSVKGPNTLKISATKASRVFEEVPKPCLDPQKPAVLGFLRFDFFIQVLQKVPYYDSFIEVLKKDRFFQASR